MNLYFGWQLNMSDPQKSISDALKQYYKKFGLPPQILLVSNQLVTEIEEFPDGMQLIVKTQRVPKNILMIGDEE